MADIRRILSLPLNAVGEQWKYGMCVALHSFSPLRITCTPKHHSLSIPTPIFFATPPFQQVINTDIHEHAEVILLLAGVILILAEVILILAEVIQRIYYGDMSSQLKSIMLSHVM